MKKFLYLVIALTALSCSNDSDPKPNGKVEEIEGIVKSGKWYINYFFIDDKEETDDYAPYNFQFLPNGSLVASDGPTSLSGSWTVTSDDNSDESQDNFDGLNFDISFTSAPALGALSEDWEIISASPRQIELRHISGGNDNPDFLTFIKI